MNALTTTAHAHPSVMPLNLDSAIRFAEIIATARTIPPAFRNNVGDCLLVTVQALQWGQNPAALMRECSVISNNLMISGKAIAAAVNGNAGLAAPLSYVFDGEGDGRSITVVGRYPNEAESREVHLTLRQARTSNAIWKNQPDQQLVYAGARIWARRHAPHVVMGVRAPEEEDAPSAPQGAPPTPYGQTLRRYSQALNENAGVPSDAVEQVNPETGEITAASSTQPNPYTLPRQSELRKDGEALMACVRGSTTDQEVQGWLDKNQAMLDEMERDRPDMHQLLSFTISRYRLALKPAEKPADVGSTLGAG